MHAPLGDCSDAERAPGEGVWGQRLRGLTMGLLLTVTLVGAESLAISAVMPEVTAELRDRWLYGWVFSAFALGSLVGITFAGYFADRTHPAKPFVVGLGLFCIGLLAGGLAPSMSVLVVARALQGLGAGALPATAYVCIARAYPAAFRSRMFALLATAWLVPGVLGPSIAVVVGRYLGWRWVFLGLLPLVSVCGALAARAVSQRVPLSAPQPAERAVTRDALLLAVGVAALLSGVTSAEWTGLIASAVGLAVALPPFLRLTPSGILMGAPGLAAAIACRGLLTASFFSVDAFMALALLDGLSAPPWVVGVTLSVTTLLWVVGAWVQERLIDRVGPRRLVRWGFVGMSGLWVIASVAMGAGLPFPIVAVVFGLAGITIGPAYAALSVTTLSLAEPGAEGRATAALQLTEVLGIALGTGVTGAIVAYGDRASFDVSKALMIAFGLSASWALLGAMASRGLPGAR